MRDTIDMAREAWISEAEAEMLQYSEECYLSCTYLADLKAFEALVRADERSGCAAQYLRIMRNAVVDAVEIEREACAEVAMTLTRRMKETEKAHFNHSAEPFIAERFGFERGLILEGQKIADAIRARGTHD